MVINSLLWKVQLCTQTRNRHEAKHCSGIMSRGNSRIFGSGVFLHITSVQYEDLQAEFVHQHKRPVVLYKSSKRDLYEGCLCRDQKMLLKWDYGLYRCGLYVENMRTEHEVNYYYESMVGKLVV